MQQIVVEEFNGHQHRMRRKWTADLWLEKKGRKSICLGFVVLDYIFVVERFKYGGGQTNSPRLENFVAGL